MNLQEGRRLFETIQTIRQRDSSIIIGKSEIFELGTEI